MLRSFAGFTPNGENIVSASLTSVIRIWNFHTSRCVKTYTGHTNVKYSSPVVIIDPDNARAASKGKGKADMDEEGTRIPSAWILSGSDTSEVCIWDGQTKELTQKLEGHTGEIKCLIETDITTDITRKNQIL
jgi:COMPASS component SWD3